MRVSVVINSRAGSVNADLIEAKVKEALFRCDLQFCRPQSLEEMCDFLHNELSQKTDYVILCGGDGTINVALQCLMKFDNTKKIPPIVIVKSGTANDLATEIGVSKRIDHAVRNIFEGYAKEIDVIEVSSEEKTAYMLTNGGLGMPATAAELANTLRQRLQALAACPKTSHTYRMVAQSGQRFVKKMGAAVYAAMSAEAIRSWNPEDWELELSIPGLPTFSTHSPLVLINNQRSIGQNFLPAPYTTNNDGTVNLLFSESSNVLQHALAVLHIRRGTTEKSDFFKSYELQEFGLKSQNPKRTLTIFGDGEILLRDVPEIAVRCIHRGLSVMVRH